MLYQEAQDTFRKTPSNDAAVLYHRAAWKAYLANRIDTPEMHQAMEEIEDFWGDNGLGLEDTLGRA